LHDDLISERSSFGEILSLWGLWLDAEDFLTAGVWTTPEFSPVRFQTAFFVARCPAKQVPYAAITELQEVEFIESGQALENWARSEVLIAPPVHKALQAVDLSANDGEIADQFRLFSKEAETGPHYFELNSRLKCIPLRTKTLPPATHTNCFISGVKEFVVIDAATPYEDEQARLIRLVDSLIEMGNQCKAIIVSHLHPDHFGGETVLRDHFLEKYNLRIPIAGHQKTIRSLDGFVDFDEAAPSSYTLKDSHGTDFLLELLHTPGHARGHLCFYDREFGFLLSSDNVVRSGSVVIAPPEGNMTDYLDSLEAMKALPGLRSLCGSHGAAISNAAGKIGDYINHRLKREEMILSLINSGIDSLNEIVEIIYKGLDERLLPLAKLSVQAHTERLEELGSVESGWTAAAG
jgi:glyoxylase-like metal-dependent hydrolase (beta-lactamase superfamily II)